MKVGEISFKRRYSAAQIIVDLASLLVLGYIGYLIFICASETESILGYIREDSGISPPDWRPLLIYVFIGAAVFAFSFFLIFRNRKMPKKLFITENNVSKYCNITDTCVSCVRLMTLLLLGEICYLHAAAICMLDAGFSIQLIIDPVIIIAVIIFTKMRLEAISETERENQKKKNKKREIIED
ncbi:MAG: hypothetical protein J6X60_04405 [Ruminiclostridium sp.]|nr:hypothetical protein [Ruminiclostridium sp.]